MLKLMIPDMPGADEILPYLRRIDAARVYSNHGQLVQELEARLEQITGAPCMVVANGTQALELVLRTSCHNILRPDVYVPALTFSATGLAVQSSGLATILADVSEDDWQLVPPACDLACNQFAAVMPVATFGRPINPARWENYTVPVIIDAAGAFPAQPVSKDPNITTCFSLHATKFIGCGEGGFVSTTNEGVLNAVRDLRTFGMHDGRVRTYGGTNAKMSEYSAAVVLASLDRLQEKAHRTQEVMLTYLEHLSLDVEHIGCYSTMLNILLPIPAAEIMPQMLAADIQTKQWYRPYLDERPEFGGGDFPVTEHLRTHLLGLPFHNFLTEADVKYVCDILRGVLR